VGPDGVVDLARVALAEERVTEDLPALRGTREQLAEKRLVAIEIREIAG
jgi:hypothetical protein